MMRARTTTLRLIAAELKCSTGQDARPPQYERTLAEEQLSKELD